MKTQKRKKSKNGKFKASASIGKKGCHNTGQKRKHLGESKAREQRRLGLKEAKPDKGNQTLDLCNGAGALAETFVLVGRTK